MLKQFLMDLRLHKGNFLAALCVCLGAALLGFILVCIIMHTEADPGNWFCMGTMICLLGGVLVPLLGGGFGYSSEFQLALSMGRTRRDFLFSYALRLLLQMLLVYGLTLLVHTAELAVYPALFPFGSDEAPFAFLYNWRLMLPAILAAAVFVMFIGSLYGRYGKKGLWVFYLVWMFCCLVLPRMFHTEPDAGNLLDMAAFHLMRAAACIPAAGWIVLGGTAVGGMAAGIILMGQRQMVKL